MVADLKKQNKNLSVRYVGDLESAQTEFKVLAKPGSILVTMGAGTVYRAGEWVVGELS